ncbi:MAG TPA: hypothetical protein VGO50_00280 [Pyrinomonadaceae bacterium]|nr:hypothetical protein [Pyrinomonadaceae bacterium]
MSAKTALCLSAVLLGSVFMAAAQTPEQGEQAESKPKNAANNDWVYNKKPFLDFWQKLVDWRKEPKNDIYSPFQYTLEGTLGADGKLIVEKAPTFSGPAEIQQIVKTAAAALSESGMFKFLQDLKSKKIKLTFAQDGSQFLFRLETEQETEREARNIFNGINTAIEVGKMMVDRGIDEETDPTNKQKEQGTLELLKLTQLKREGSIIIIDTAVPNKMAEDMYQNFKKDLEEKSNPQGVAINSNTNPGISK